MSFNGSGTALINSSGQPVAANTLIDATVFNALTADIATMLSTCVTKDGQTTITENIPMNGKKITGLGTGSAASDAVTYAQTITALAASGGSALSGFLQAGTGAAATTVQAKLRESISVKDFGAVGDGTTDDTAAIQAAIDAFPTGCIHFGNGANTYKVTSALLLTDASGHDFQGQLIGDGATINFTHSTATNAADSAIAHGFQAYPVTNSSGGDVTGMRGVVIQGLKITSPTNGAGIYLANCQRVAIRDCQFTGGRYGVAMECCINTIIEHNHFYRFINAGIGLIMSGDTTRVWYGSATPANTYWNDSPQILGNGFATDLSNGQLAMILDMGSQSESIRYVCNNYFYSGTNAQCQYGIVARNSNYNLESNWFENINYPVRFLSTNANEGGAGTTLTGVTAAQPSGTYTVGTFVDGFAYTGTIQNNYTVLAVNDFDVSGINGPCLISGNLSSGSTGAVIKSTQSGNQWIVDAGNATAALGGVYKDVDFGQYVHTYIGDDTGTVNAATGNIGEYIESSVLVGSGAALTTATPLNVTSISLTAGDWEVWGTGGFAYTGATATIAVAGASPTSATFDTGRNNVQTPIPGAVGTVEYAFAIPRTRRQLTATTTIYLVAQANFTAGSAKGFGALCARRVR